MFNNIVGNEEIKEYLKKTIELKNYSSSYIFSGKAGLGKKTIAKEWAKEILCSNEEERVKFDNDAHPDFKEIDPVDKSVKIEQIRSIREKIIEKPIQTSKKIYLIDDSETMTEESQNCLLKTLEEPPEYAIIILITSNENRLLQTIKSRCICLRFKNLNNEEIKKVAGDVSENVIEMLNGSLSNIGLIKENEETFNDISNLVNTIENKELKDALNTKVLYDNKEIIVPLLEYMNVVLYKKGFIELIEYVEKTKRKIIQNNNYEMSIDYLLINTWKCLH